MKQEQGKQNKKEPPDNKISSYSNNSWIKWTDVYHIK